MSSYATPAGTPVHGVLADALPGERVRDLGLVVGAAAFVGVCAQLAFPLPFTPVPFTLQPLAVLVAGAALGWQRGALAMLLYALVGTAGVPWFAEGSGGLDVLTGPSFGYILGYPFVAALVGWLAARRMDRTPVRTGVTMLAGTAVIYAFGVPWLMADMNVGLAEGLALGMVPFVIGDLLKVVIGAGLLPSAWALVRRLG